ncbi:hypothetical protein JTE90_011902 [Oedothorax gibbosus]|uniref:Uncharacterized protein n=1 Tax=Oedothorax gibbosus TaxID=931172 RepID=A0AAV6V1G4_9ARAC|nr:hypothetical protein JTE90_011902 [Oedothorax gibbosus]
MVITEVLPSDTYGISQLEATNGRMYSTTAHVSQLKSWRGWDEEDADDVSDEDSGKELESQRPKRTTRKPQCYP